MKYIPLIGRGRGGFLGGIVNWFIRIIIYQICIGFIMEIFGVSQMVALFIFLGILAVISFAGYMFKQRMAPGVDDF